MLVFLLAGAIQLGAPAPSHADDRAVYAALVDSGELRTRVDRMAAGAGLAVPAPVVVFDRSLHLCDPSVPPVRPMGCLRSEEIDNFTSAEVVNNRPRFDGVLSQTERLELAKAFRERNRTAVELRGLGLKRVVWTTPSSLDATLKATARATRGYVSFSQPAYWSGFAFVEVRYVCGGLCGYGWHFLLEKRDGAWHIIGTELLWIS